MGSKTLIVTDATLIKQRNLLYLISCAPAVCLGTYMDLAIQKPELKEYIYITCIICFSLEKNKDSLEESSHYQIIEAKLIIPFALVNLFNSICKNVSFN